MLWRLLTCLATIGAAGVALTTVSGSAVDAQGPASRLRDATVTVTPRVLAGKVVAVRIATGPRDGSVLFGSRFDIDMLTARGPETRYAGSTETGAIVTSSNSDETVIWDAVGHFGAAKLQVRIPSLESGRYRVRVGFNKRLEHGAEMFDLNASFTVR